jgi:hypothetical protein
MTTTQARTIVFAACQEAGLTPFQSALVYCQGIQESGYNSPVFQKNNNAFGMKMPRVRKSPYILGKGSAAPKNESHAGDPFNVYARYAGLRESVLDLLHRHQNFGIRWSNIKTVDSYIKFLIDTSYFQGSPAVYRKNVAALVKEMGIA